MSGAHLTVRPDGSRGAVREALRRVVARVGPPPATDAPPAERRRWRNVVLDEVGSDARPVVELLLRVQEHGVLAGLPAGSLAPAAWAPIRARLAFAYAAETFLDGEMSRWVVDAWGYALGVIDEGGLYVPLPPAALPVTAPVPPPVAARLPVAGAPATPPPPGAVTTPAARPGRVPGRVRRAIARANAPPPPNPFPKNFDRIAGYTFMGIVTAAAFAMWVGIVDRREAGGLEVADEPVLAGVGMPAPALAPLPRGAVERPSPSAPAPAAALPMPEGVAPMDSLWLRDGTVRTGFVERVAADGLLLRDPWSDTTTPLGFDEVVTWRTAHGERLPVGGAAGPAVPTPAGDSAESVGTAAAHEVVPVPTGNAGVGLGHSAIVGGLAGRYTVRRRVLDVTGSESCGAVAAAVRASAATVETLEHRPGEAEFALSSRPGLRGTIDDDGRFRTAVVEGASRGVHYRFRMSGQFLPDGFRAETESETRAVLRWGDVQQCRMTVALHAERLR